MRHDGYWWTPQAGRQFVRWHGRKMPHLVRDGAQRFIGGYFTVGEGVRLFVCGGLVYK